MKNITALTDDVIQGAKLAMIHFDQIYPDVLRSAFWIRKHTVKNLAAEPSWQLIMVVSNPSDWYDYPGNSNPAFNIIVEGVDDQNNLLVTQVLETTGFESITITNQIINRFFTIDVVVYKALKN